MCRILGSLCFCMPARPSWPNDAGVWLLHSVLLIFKVKSNGVVSIAITDDGNDGLARNSGNVCWTELAQGTGVFIARTAAGSPCKVDSS